MSGDGGVAEWRDVDASGSVSRDMDEACGMLGNCRTRIQRISRRRTAPKIA